MKHTSRKWEEKEGKFNVGRQREKGELGGGGGVVDDCALIWMILLPSVSQMKGREEWASFTRNNKINNEFKIQSCIH